MKKILITGIAGFIGFHVAKHLVQRNDFVIGIDNFNTYYDVTLKKQRAHHLKNLKVEILQQDICQENSLKHFIEKHQITHIIHLAAQAGVRRSLTHPNEYLKANIEGFLEVLKTCQSFPDTVLIYASSSSVYGTNQRIPFQEDEMTDNPANLYGATKKSNELMANAYHHLYGIKTTGLRFFTVYGPWGRPDMAYYSFAKSIMEEKPIVLFNHGKMARDFTYVEDIVEGVIAALDLGASCEVFNLGNSQPIGVMELVKTLEKMLHKRANISFLPMQPGEISTTYANISKGKKILNYQPKVSFLEGMEKFVDWFIHHPKEMIPSL